MPGYTDTWWLAMKEKAAVEVAVEDCGAKPLRGPMTADEARAIDALKVAKRQQGLWFNYPWVSSALATYSAAQPPPQQQPQPTADTANMPPPQSKPVPHVDSADSGQGSGKRKAPEEKGYTLPDGRISLIRTAPPRGERLAGEAKAGFSLEDEDYPYIATKEAEALHKAGMTANQQAHANWACRFMHWRCVKSKKSWHDWHTRSLAAWEVLADAQHAWPDNDPTPFSEEEAGARSWGRWVNPSDYRTRSAQHTDPIERLRERKRRGAEKERGIQPAKRSRKGDPSPSGRKTPPVAKLQPDLGAKDLEIQQLQQRLAELNAERQGRTPAPAQQQQQQDRNQAPPPTAEGRASPAGQRQGQQVGRCESRTL